MDLPRSYGVDDLPIILQDRSFASDGALVYSPSPLATAYGSRGDTIIVNGTSGRSKESGAPSSVHLGQQHVHGRRQASGGPRGQRPRHVHQRQTPRYDPHRRGGGGRNKRDLGDLFCRHGRIPSTSTAHRSAFLKLPEHRRPLTSRAGRTSFSLRKRPSFWSPFTSPRRRDIPSCITATSPNTRRQE